MRGRPHKSVLSSYQYGGETKSGPLPSGDEGIWRCLSLIKLSSVEWLDAPWRTGPHAPQPCVPRHSRRTTHLCSFRMTHTKKSVWCRSGRVVDIEGDALIIIPGGGFAVGQNDCLHHDARWRRDLHVDKALSAGYGEPRHHPRLPAQVAASCGSLLASKPGLLLASAEVRMARRGRRRRLSWRRSAERTMR